MRRIQLVGTIKCTGCSACASVCPTGSITMKEDREGFLQPFIENSSCIMCHRCEQRCPILNDNPIQSVFETKAYAAINKDDSIRIKSSSGGVFYALAKRIIEKDGVVFGARFDEKWEVVHDYAETIEEVIPLLGSKYIQSRIGNVYKQVKFFLDKGRWVLFSGTPCQISGLLTVLGKDYSKLVLVDLACHGVPSPGVWRSYLNGLKDSDTITSVSFRDKTNGWIDYCISIKRNHEAVVLESHMDNIYLRGFLKNVFLRNSCYNCRYRSLHRDSDITLADYWGVKELLPEMFDNKGTSIVLVHSEKGRRVFGEVEHNLVFVEQKNEDAVRFNPNIDRQNPLALRRKRFFRVFGLTSFNKSAHIINRDIFVKRVLRRIKRIAKGC